MKKQLGGSLKGKKIAYIFYDNPGGPGADRGARGPRDSAKGFQLKMFAVPPPGVEMGAQVARHRPALPRGLRDRPSVRRRARRVDQGVEAGRLSRCARSSSFVWGSAEANIDAAGGFAVAEGYYTMQFAGVGQDYPVLNEIREMYKKEGKPAPQGDGVHRLLQPRGAGRRAPRRGHPERAQGQAGRQDHRRRREGGLREDLQLHPRRAGAAAQDHGRPTTRAAGSCRSGR